MTNTEKTLEILRLTEDGNSLSLSQLHLVEAAVNSILSPAQQKNFDDLYQKVLDGNYQEFFHGIENVTQDSEGCICWKGIPVDHFNCKSYEEERAAAQELVQMCKYLESTGVKVSGAKYLAAWLKYYAESND